MSPLASHIRSTVAFFDIFDYPLTAFEIWQYLPVATTYAEVQTALEQSEPLEQSEGFFFLPGRREIIAIRRSRYLSADRKIKKARRRLRVLSWLPWIQLIALANTIGCHNLRSGGDTDLFIITKPNRLWLTRLYAIGILKLFNLRPTPRRAADRFCLSFLVDENALDLSRFRIDGDLYFTYWTAGLVPLYGRPETWTAFMKTNAWLDDALPNRVVESVLPRLRFRRARKPNWSLLNAYCERLAHALQAKFMNPTIRELANRDQRVVTGDHVLKLHTIDRREQFRTEHAKRIERLAI